MVSNEQPKKTPGTTVDPKVPIHLDEQQSIESRTERKRRSTHRTQDSDFHMPQQQHRRQFPRHTSNNVLSTISIPIVDFNAPLSFSPTSHGFWSSLSPRALHGAVVGRYVILAKLGAGGMGVVDAAYGPEHLETAWTLGELGNIEVELGEPAAALIRLERAVLLFEGEPGSEAASRGST